MVFVFAGDMSAAETAADSLGSNAKSQTRWISQLIDNRFHVHDTTIYYPAFPRFVLKVYNWGDRTFNYYDKNYVVGTGKNWKLQGKTYGWIETQTMLFPKNSLLSMHLNFYSDAGAYISFMAVSVGYMWNMDRLFDRNTKRHTFNFDFTCSRFSINYSSVSSEGGMILTRIGEYNDGKDIRYNFDDISIKTTNLDAYYFFNHRRYSHAAAYSFSKYQLRTAGTALIGLNLAEMDSRMDFSGLPDDMREALPLANPVYKYTYESATDGHRNMLANNYKAWFGCVYNHRKLFAAAQLRSTGSLYFNSNFTHFSTFSALTLTVGMRF